MKKSVLLGFLLLLSLSYAQEEIITHNKIPIKVNYTQLLGINPISGWGIQIFPTEIPYNGEMITVNYPQYVKNFSLWIQGRLVSGAFAIKYDRFQNSDYLMFQVFLYWDQQDISWFIAKSYGDNNIVNFYESDPVTEATLDPRIPTEQGGPHIWRLGLEGFEPMVEVLYNHFLEDLKGKTRDALIQALADHPRIN